MAVITFDAPVYSIESWAIIRLPREASGQLPSRGQVMVKGTVSDAPFQTPLEPDGMGGHWLHVNTALQKAAKVGPGDTATVRLEVTKDWIEPVVPADVSAALAANPQVQALWRSITPMARWEWMRWINSTKVPETRQKRITVSCSKMSRGERRPCCFNRSMCCVAQVSKNGVLLEPTAV